MITDILHYLRCADSAIQAWHEVHGDDFPTPTTAGRWFDGARSWRHVVDVMNDWKSIALGGRWRRHFHLFRWAGLPVRQFIVTDWDHLASRVLYYRTAEALAVDGTSDFDTLRRIRARVG